MLYMEVPYTGRTIPRHVKGSISLNDSEKVNEQGSVVPSHSGIVVLVFHWRQASIAAQGPEIMKSELEMKARKLLELIPARLMKCYTGTHYITSVLKLDLGNALNMSPN